MPSNFLSFVLCAELRNLQASESGNDILRSKLSLCPFYSTFEVSLSSNNKGRIKRPCMCMSQQQTILIHNIVYVSLERDNESGFCSVCFCFGNSDVNEKFLSPSYSVMHP